MSAHATFRPGFALSAEGMRDAVGAQWETATRHRFVQQIAADDIGDSVFRAYLLQDHLFIDALVRLVAHTISVAPGMEEQRRLSGFLAVLASDENDFFERAFDALGVTAATRAAARKRDATLAFEDLFLAACQESSYAAALGVLAPVEWIYLDWATWAKREGQASTRFWLQEWVDLHTGDAFAGFVTWLCAELDRHAPLLPPAAQERLVARFARAVRLEAEFFSDGYNATAPPRSH